jgi:hypothetical protein
MEAGTECGESYERLLRQIGGYFNDTSEREVERRLAEVRHARKTNAVHDVGDPDDLIDVSAN